MGLRTRISLIVVAAVLLVTLGLGLAAHHREGMIEERRVAATVNDRAMLWTKTVESQIQVMEDKLWLVRDDPRLRAALARGDLTAVNEIGNALFQEMTAQRLATRLDLIAPDGRVMYSSEASLEPSAVIAAPHQRALLARGGRLLGVGNDAERRVYSVAAFAIETGGQAVGVGAYATAIDASLAELAQNLGAEVLIVNRRGRLLAGTAPALWDALHDSERLDALAPWQQIGLGGKTYTVTTIPVRAELGTLLANLTTIEDVTESHARQRRVEIVTVAAILGFLVLVVAALSLHLRRALAPLTAAVSVLDAMSRGELDAEVEAGERADEVGRIAEAVNVYRRDLVAFHRIRRSREKQRRRQERFIRREMEGLARTLDEDERASLLADLAGLDRPAAEPGTDADGLALIAAVFKRMSELVHRHHEKLGGLIEELRQALESKTAFLALQRELEIGQRVQLSMLPSDPPASEAIDLAGRMIPAKEVGGDFYDFFPLDDSRVALVVADVSGKGVPAALFMAIARTLLRAIAQNRGEPAACLTRLNELLVQNNREELFVTVFYGVFDPRTGELIYANGGHNAPFVVAGGSAAPLERTGDMALGVMGGLDYRQRTMRLRPGERLFLYTDGVTEAFNPDGEEYSEARLIAKLGAITADGASGTLDEIVRDVAAFARGEPQSDDITCVLLAYRAAARTPAKRRRAARAPEMAG